LFALVISRKTQKNLRWVNNRQFLILMGLSDFQKTGVFCQALIKEHNTFIHWMWRLFIEV
jgi:hypothetical protein